MPMRAKLCAHTHARSYKESLRGLCPCPQRVKMQIINPILFQGQSQLGMWLWNPVWIGPYFTWSTMLALRSHTEMSKMTNRG